MSMKIRIAFAAFGLFLAIGALVGIVIYLEWYRVDMSGIEHIEQAQRGPNDFNDPAGDIAVQSVDDIGYVVKGDYLLDIHYGRQVIAMNKKCFESKEFRTALSEIGIKVYTRKDDETGKVMYKVTYWDDKVSEYSRIN